MGRIATGTVSAERFSGRGDSGDWRGSNVYFGARPREIDPAIVQDVSRAGQRKSTPVAMGKRIEGRGTRRDQEHRIVAVAVVEEAADPNRVWRHGVRKWDQCHEDRQQHQLKTEGQPRCPIRFTMGRSCQVQGGRQLCESYPRYAVRDQRSPRRRGSYHRSGEVTGTPAGDLFGVSHTGESFRIMAIDIQTSQDSEIARIYRLENWISGSWRRRNAHGIQPTRRRGTSSARAHDSATRSDSGSRERQTNVEPLRTALIDSNSTRTESWVVIGPDPVAQL